MVGHPGDGYFQPAVGYYCDMYPPGGPDGPGGPPPGGPLDPGMHPPPPGFLLAGPPPQSLEDARAMDPHSGKNDWDFIDINAFVNR